MIFKQWIDCLPEREWDGGDRSITSLPSVSIHLSLNIASQNQLLEPSYASHCALKFAALQRKAEPAVVGYPSPGAAVYAQPRGSEDGFPDVARIQLALKAISFEALPNVGSRFRQHRYASTTAGNVPATTLQRLFIVQR